MNDQFSLAAGYDRFVGRYSRALGRGVCAAAGVRAGQTAVDVGCGPGGLTAELVAVLGADHVAAVDPSAPFAAACADRNPGVRVEVAPAETLPFADGEFDHALAQLVVNFLDDPAAGVTEMCRVVKPGGTTTAATWDYAGHMEMLRHFWDAVTALDATGAGLDEGRRMRFGTPDELTALLAAAGLADVAVTAVDVAADYDGFDDLWGPFELGVGPAGAYAAALDDEPRAALAAEYRRRLGVGDAPFRLSARAWVGTGRR